ncbi:hypothetical protein PR202_ga11870 [Eleusine coracana subsp. coracana]|uniref:Uncharacterized protein n=1 Tax=Eleusine coracana subsp. coracana TaxID=191504 RepID=A0AAV5CAR2_ELECO|nr:hypothetical protein PR202_ga11870 [Eleusine coracana subsp. coracana]
MVIAKALDLMPFVQRRGWRRHTVRDALHNHSWINDVIGGLPVSATWQLLQLCDALDEVIIQEGQPDEHKWLSAASGKFFTRSTIITGDEWLVAIGTSAVGIAEKSTQSCTVLTNLHVRVVHMAI